MAQWMTDSVMVALMKKKASLQANVTVKPSWTGQDVINASMVTGTSQQIIRMDVKVSRYLVAACAEGEGC